MLETRVFRALRTRLSMRVAVAEQLYETTSQGTSDNTSELSESNLGVSKYSKTKCKNF